jgi:hypothetical protein
MAFSQYPDNIVTSIYVDEEIQLSDITYSDKTQVEYLGLQIFKYGLNTGVTMTIKAYDTSDVLIDTSEIVRVSEIPTETDYFYGWVYFRFAKRVNLPNSPAKRFKLALSGYTFSESSWIGAVYDWPITMGYNSSPDQITDSPFALDIIGAN